MPAGQDESLRRMSEARGRLQAAEARADRLDAALDELPFGLAVCGADGRLRHANVRAGNVSYPIRAIRTAEFLSLRNFEPDRWPAGDPPLYGDVDEHLSIDGSPSKQAVVEHGDKADVKRLFELAFGKRPAEELYDLSEDPWQMTNVAADPRYSERKAKLRTELDHYLAETRDPRATGNGSWWNITRTAERNSSTSGATSVKPAISPVANRVVSRA